MVDFTAYQDVQCVYPISGQYGTLPRALYYALLLFVVLFKRQDWLTAGAAAYCFTFSGSAVIHAFILCQISLLGYSGVSWSFVQLANLKSISFELGVYDLDIHGTFAIIGAGCLVIAPMALWSPQFRHPAAYPNLILWIFFMYVGLGTSFIMVTRNDQNYQDYRFCSPGYKDAGFQKIDSSIILSSTWNETIWSYFEALSPDTQHCLYPCLYTNTILHQPGDAQIRSSPRSFNVLAVASAMILNFFFSVWAVTTPIYRPLYEPVRLQSHKSTVLWFKSWISERKTSNIVVKQCVRHYLMVALVFYSKIISPILFVLFLVFIERIVYFDPQSESMQLVGQWAPLAGIGFAFFGVVVGKYTPIYVERRRRYLKRRAMKKSGALEESRFVSWREARVAKQARSAWGRADTVWVQGGDEC